MTHNYVLGGKDNFPADRLVADVMAMLYPDVVVRIRMGRLFALRAIRHLAEAGIRQYIDLGCGIPVTDPTHEIVQDVVAAGSLVVYADCDQFVAANAQALKSDPAKGLTHAVRADLLKPHEVLRKAANMLDLTQPVALLLTEVLQDVAGHFLVGDAVQALMDGLPVGSYLVLSHPTGTTDEARAANAFWNCSNPSAQTWLRAPELILEYFQGLELLPPGLVPYNRWRSEFAPLSEAERDVDGSCGVARRGRRC